MRIFTIILLTSIVCSAELPDAPTKQDIKAENRAFWVINGINAAATFADMSVSMRSHFQPGVGHCHEGNGAFGLYPSNKRIVLQMTGELVGITLVTYLLKKHHYDWFVVIPLASALIHTTATINTANNCF